MSRKPDDRVEQAKNLYLNGKKLVEIASQLNVPAGTVRRWKSTYEWDSERSEKNNERSEMQKSEISWIDIEHEYVTDLRRKPDSLEKLAKKYGLPIQTIKDQSAKGKWSEKRTTYKQMIAQKAIEKSSVKDADRIVRLLRIADKASEKAEKALDEIETYTVKNKKKIKTVDYDYGPGKPTKEVTEEFENIEAQSGPVDRQGLLFITNALKNIKDLYGVELDVEEKRVKMDVMKSKAQLNEEEEAVDDGFLEALSGTAAEDWIDEDDDAEV